MNYFISVKSQQILKETFLLLGSKLSNQLTFFHRKFNCIVENDQVEPQHFVHRRSAFERVAYFCNTILFDHIFE